MSLQFEPREMVCWYHPVQLARTAFRVLFANYVTAVVDIREVQAGLKRVTLSDIPSAYPPDPSKAKPNTVFDVSWPARHEPIWVDYVADLGDGWDATYSVAALVARETLKVRGLDRLLQRADLLVLGGDCVYPTPSLQEYGDRLVAPYDAALSDVSGPAACEDARQRGKPAPHDPNLLVIPGNHDWYDGLMSFGRLFCRGGRIGAWRTRQTHSYFAARLPHNWTLWGIDIQLDSRIDTPQLQFFANAAKELRAENPNAKPRVIICTARPAWLQDRPAYEQAHRNYWFFVAHALDLGCDPWLTLSGDLHHYSRYESPAGRQLITAGGGGSYFSATHDLPKSVRSPLKDNGFVKWVAGYQDWPDGDGCTFGETGFTYPSRADSRRMALRTLGFPFLSANWTCCVLVGLLYAWVAWTLRWSASPDFPVSQLRSSLHMLASFSLTADGLHRVGRFALDALSASPAPWLPVLTIVGCCTLFCTRAELGRPRWRRWLWGALHGVAQVALGIATAWLLARAFNAVLGDRFAAPWEATLWFVVLIVFGGLLGGFLLGAYLVVSDRVLGWHVNEVFAAQSCPDYRCFIRMCFETDGKLTLYPIALRRVARRWRHNVGAREWESRFEPRDEGPEPELIEGPITVRVMPPV